MPATLSTHGGNREIAATPECYTMTYDPWQCLYIIDNSTKKKSSALRSVSYITGMFAHLMSVPMFRNCYVPTEDC